MQKISNVDNSNLALINTNMTIDKSRIDNVTEYMSRENISLELKALKKKSGPACTPKTTNGRKKESQILFSKGDIDDVDIEPACGSPYNVVGQLPVYYEKSVSTKYNQSLSRHRRSECFTKDSLIQTKSEEKNRRNKSVRKKSKSNTTNKSKKPQTLRYAMPDHANIDLQ